MSRKKGKSSGVSIGAILSSIAGTTLLSVLLSVFFNESPLLEGYRRASNVPHTLHNFLFGWFLIFLIVGSVLLVRFIGKKREQSREAVYHRETRAYNQKER